MKGKLFFWKYLLFICSSLILVSCDQTFQPLKENSTVPLSIYGYLDASADTQWVRVTPIRKLINQPSVKPEMQVTLEHLETGNITVMNDSLFLFNDGFHILNSWSLKTIEPGQTYRIKAVRPDGAASQAQITLPGDFPAPTLLDRDGCRAEMRIEGLENLADVQSQWHVRILYLDQSNRLIFETERFYFIPHRKKAERVADGAYTVQIDTREELTQIRNQLLVPPGTSVVIQALSRQLYVASGGPEWNEEITSLSDIAFARFDLLSNVENGLGYILGIVSKSIPYIPVPRCF